MTANWLRVVVVAAALMHLTDEAHACSCLTSGPPCQAAWTADVVFAGTVRSVERIDHDETGQPYQSVLVRFDVDRAFVNAVAGPVDVVTGSGGGDCGYSFVRGRRYVVYAWKRGASLTTGICSRTRPIENAEEDLRYLTSIPARNAGARVYGRVNEWRRDPAEERAVDYGPVEGVSVSLRGATFVRDGSTDAHGRFEISNVPTGKATLAIRPPAGFDTRYLERELDLSDLRACSQQDFEIAQRATASGAVVDASGRPVAGVEVDAVAAELAGFAPPPYQHPVKTDGRGVFEFQDLPPGTYVFGVNVTVRPGSRRIGTAVFLPGTARAGEATVIELKAGDSTEVGVLRLPAR